MKRLLNSLILSAVMLVFLGGALLPPAIASAAGTITLTYANFPPPMTFPCVQMERWKTEVERRTDGTIQVQTFPGSTLLNPKNMFDGVVSGVADIGCLAMSYQPGRFPVSEAVDLPLGFTSAKAASLVLYDLIQYKHKPKEFEKVKIITLFTCPPTNFMTSKPVKCLEDLRGFEVRVPGTAVDMINRLGGTPVAMPMSETPDAIQKGVVKGIVSSMEILKDFNFAAYCPYATLANMNVVTFAIVMNREKWDSLPDDAKTVIDDLRREQAVWTGEYVDGHVAEALEWAKKTYNHQVLELPESDAEKIPELLQPMIDAYIKKVSEAGLDGEKIVEEVRNLRDKYQE